MNYIQSICFFPQKDKEDQWLEKKFLGNKDHIVLEHLQWNMEYEVQIIATNRLGQSNPTMYEFIMPPKPNIIAGTCTVLSVMSCQLLPPHNVCAAFL